MHLSMGIWTVSILRLLQIKLPNTCVCLCRSPGVDGCFMSLITILVHRFPLQHGGEGPGQEDLLRRQEAWSKEEQTQAGLAKALSASQGR